MKGIVADAAKNLLADDDDNKSSGDNRPPGHGGRNQHGKQQSEQSGISVTDGDGSFGHQVEDQFPDNGCGKRQADHTECRHAVLVKTHQKCRQGCQHGVIAALRYPAPAVIEGRMGNNQLFLSKGCLLLKHVSFLKHPLPPEF